MYYILYTTNNQHKTANAKRCYTLLATHFLPQQIPAVPYFHILQIAKEQFVWYDILVIVCNKVFYCFINYKDSINEPI